MHSNPQEPTSKLSVDFLLNDENVNEVSDGACDMVMDDTPPYQPLQQRQFTAHGSDPPPPPKLPHIQTITPNNNDDDDEFMSRKRSVSFTAYEMSKRGGGPPRPNFPLSRPPKPNNFLRPMVAENGRTNPPQSRRTAYPLSSKEPKFVANSQPSFPHGNSLIQQPHQQQQQYVVNSLESESNEISDNGSEYSSSSEVSLNLSPLNISPNTSPSNSPRIRNRGRSLSNSSDTKHFNFSMEAMTKRGVSGRQRSLSSSEERQNLFPHKHLAYEMGLTSDPQRTWRFRDFKRSLFERIKPDHASFIENSCEHSLLKQRLPHRMSMAAFCKRIMLLAFHFIIRDGKPPRFWAKVHQPKLRANLAENYDRYNTAIASMAHTYFFSGVPVDQAIRQAQEQYINQMREGYQLQPQHAFPMTPNDFPTTPEKNLDPNHLQKAIGKSNEEISIQSQFRNNGDNVSISSCIQ
eukprot:gb/GECH01000633.1/.p1 GENE.gb/GECH01000633.1/~~gb/GECH01000633.1/.p1  ORF type:complete len:462 (+),score=114.32 gb/GECH01000633.1/:1-1386(+)